MNEEGELWRRVLEAKFGLDEKGWFTREVTKPHWKSTWEKIDEG